MGRFRINMMSKGLVCESNQERTHCCLPGADYRRTKREAKGWPNPDMPIVLCPKHAGDRVPLTPEEVKKVWLNMKHNGDQDKD